MSFFSSGIAMDKLMMISYHPPGNNLPTMIDHATLMKLGGSHTTEGIKVGERCGGKRD